LVLNPVVRSDPTESEAADPQRDGGAPKARIFISYSRKDIAFADRLATALKARGFEPLIDRAEIYAFEDWWKRIQALISRADTIVFVLSPDAVASDICTKEVAHAASLNKRFAPIVARRTDDNATPEALRRLNFVFFDDPAQFEVSVDKLAEALQTDIGWIRQHTEFGEAAHHWSAAARPGGLLLRSPALENAERWIASRPRGAPEPTDETQAFVAESRRGTTRRRNRLTGSLAAGLILALGLAALAYWQRGVAVQQTARADKNFTAAKATIDSVIFDIADGLKDIQGIPADTVRRILGQVESTVGQLASRTSNDPEVRRSQAIMFTLFANTYLKVGATDLAGDYARKATATFRELFANDVGNPLRPLDLSRGLDSAGDVLAAQGDRAGALAAYRESLDIARALSAKDPGNTGLRDDVATSLDFVGDMLTAQGDRSGALASYRESVDIRRQISAKEPGNAKWLIGLGASLDRIGDTLMAQRDAAGALAAYRESFDIAHELSTTDPGNADWRRKLMMSESKLADVLMAEGDATRALAAYRESLDTARWLSAKDPSNVLWRWDVSVCVSRIGEVLMAQGDRAGAIAAYRESLDIRRELSAKDPGNALWQTEVVKSLGDLAQAGDDPRGRLSEALQIVNKLKAQGKLKPAQLQWIDVIEAELAKLSSAAVK
jgi:tetratricopeptide (TPR) repeat protein